MPNITYDVICEKLMWWMSPSATIFLIFVSIYESLSIIVGPRSGSVGGNCVWSQRQHAS
jgi:hypothetical protein